MQKKSKKCSDQNPFLILSLLQISQWFAHGKLSAIWNCMSWPSLGSSKVPASLMVSPCDSTNPSMVFITFETYSWPLHSLTHGQRDFVRASYEKVLCRLIWQRSYSGPWTDLMLHVMKLLKNVLMPPCTYSVSSRCCSSLCLWRYREAVFELFPWTAEIPCVWMCMYIQT